MLCNGAELKPDARMQEVSWGGTEFRAVVGNSMFGMLSVLSPDIHTCEDSHHPMAPLFQGDLEPHKIFSDVISLQNVVWKIISTPKKPIMGRIPELYKSSVNS